MRVKLDENLGRTHAAFLRRQGYDVDRIPEERLSGAGDRLVWEQVCVEGRFFLTLDRDFSDVGRFRPAHIRGSYFCAFDRADRGRCSKS